MSATKYAEYPSLRLYDALEVPYVLVPEHSWSGPLWTGHCMMLTRDGYGDEGYLHELFHWIMASPAQRRYPDFAMGRWVNSELQTFSSSSTPYLLGPHNNYGHDRKTSEDQNAGWGERTVKISTAHRQEEAACVAMYLYHVVVGNTTWDKPLTTEAADDFNGSWSEVTRADFFRHTRKILDVLFDLDPSLCADDDMVWGYYKEAAATWQTV
jgi:hypothetical protein